VAALARPDSMQVILREDVKNLGKRGEIVKVADGYARNFLFPRGLADDLSEGRMKQAQVEQRKAQGRQDRLLQEAQALGERISAMAIELKLKVGENGKPFGSVTAQDIASALAQQGVEVDKRRIEIAAPIRQLGEYVVEVRPHAKVTARLRITVVRA
jgi:large subunit ribosomal protein L9